MGDSFIDQNHFKRILNRNVAVPLGFGFLSAFFFSAIVYFLLNVSHWVERSVEGVAYAHDMLKVMGDMEASMRGYLIAGEDVFLEPYRSALPVYDRQLERIAQYAGDDPVQLNRVGRIGRLHELWVAFAEEAIERRTRNEPVINFVRSKQGLELREEQRRLLNDFIAYERQIRAERTDTTETITTALIGGFLLFSLIFSGLLVYFGRRDLISLSDSYSESLEQQQAHAAALEKQAWYRTGQTQLSESMIGEQTLPTLGQNVLGFLGRYLGMSVGALYVTQEGKLQRVAEFGWDRERLQAGRALELGEGLVGQVALERRAMPLDNVPQGYLNVSSALGSADAASVLIFPVEDSGMLNAVLEIGFLRPLLEEDSELLRRVSDNIGSAIEAARYRQRLQRMLAETQQLNEELQVQQEELRAANEELEEQSNALRESQAHMEEQQAELEQTNEQLAEQTQALAQQRDEMDLKNHRLHEVQLMLEERADELQRASRYKSEFLANMSHELRTPLNSSLILAKLLADNPHGNLQEDQVQFARSIYSAGNDLLNLINDILDISKVEAGKLDVHPELLILTRLVDGLKSLFLAQALEKTLQFDVQLDEDVPASLYTDRQRLEQILKNLLSNAFKFTEKGSVELRVTRRDDQQIAFAVRDSGIGIPADQQDVIFEAFRQADGTTNRRYGGTGLGLSISRELAQLLGGTIEVSSEPGAGSVFTLIVPETYSAPVAEQEPEPLPAPEPINIPAVPAPIATPIAAAPRAVLEPGVAALADDRERFPFERSVLVIEDEPQFAGILRDLAHELKYSCLIAQNADHGFDTAVQYRPDAILLDMRLPDHSGLTVLERLKENPITRHIPVHIMSADEPSPKALQKGAVGYVQKPLEPSQISAALETLEERGARKLRRVLVVEDDERVRRGIRELSADYDVTVD